MTFAYTLLIYLSLGNGWFSDHSTSEVDSLQLSIAPVFKEGNFAKSIELAEQSVQFSKELEYAYGEARGYFILAFIYDKKNDTNKAFYMYLQAANVLEFQNNEQSALLYTSVLLNSGIILRENFQYDAAISFYDRAIEIAKKRNFLEQRQKLLYNKASVLEEKESYIEALKVLEQSRLIAENLGHHSMVIKCQNLEGLIYNNQEISKTAAQACFRSILNNQHLNKYDRAKALHNMALTFKEQNRDSAKYYLDHALEIKQKLNDPEMLYRTFYELAEWNFNQKKFDRVNYWGELAKNIYSELPIYPDYFEIFYLLSKANLNDPQTLDFYLTRFHDESSLFHDKQEGIIKQLRRFHASLIQAGFKLEQKAEAAQVRSNEVMRAAFFIIILISLSGYIIYNTKQKRLADYRTKQIQRILRHNSGRRF